MDGLDMCESGNHVVGSIAGKQVRLADWDVAIVAFGAKIDDFNIRGRTQQVNHPGFAERCNFCPECGASLADVVLKPLEWNS